MALLHGTYNGLVAEMLGCSNPEKIGYIKYRLLREKSAGSLVERASDTLLRFWR